MNKKEGKVRMKNWKRHNKKKQVVSWLISFFILIAMLSTPLLLTQAGNLESGQAESGKTTEGIQKDSNVISPEITAEGVHFHYYAPQAENVYLSGSMNGWAQDADRMELDEETGYWSITKSLTAGSYEYKFIEDGNWVTDPLNPEQKNGNSSLLVTGLADDTDTIAKGKTIQLPEYGTYYDSANPEGRKALVTYQLKQEQEGLTLDGYTLTVEESYAADRIVLVMTAEDSTASFVLDIVENQYTYTIYYYDSIHNSVDSTDLWIWENGGEGASAGREFQESVVLEDGNTWLKATCVLSYTNLGIIPRSKGAWDWQSATVNYENKNKAEEVTIYIIADDSTAYTELPEIQEARDRHVIVEYIRPEGDYDGWNIYTWNSGYGSDVQIDMTKQGDKQVFDIPVKSTTSSLSFVMRKGPQDNPFQNKDGGDHNIVIPLDQDVVRAVFVQDQGVQYVYPYNSGYELDGEENQIHFYYRNDEHFLNGTLEELEGKVEVEVDGNSYPMSYDEETGRFIYSLTGLTEGEHKYRYLVDGESLIDVYNEVTTEQDGITYSVYSYQKFEGEASASLTPATITCAENTVLKVVTPQAEGMEVASITADTSAIGGKEELTISPELNAITLSVPDTLEPGNYTIPVCVKDQYGNQYRTETELTVKDGESDWDDAIIYFMLTDRFFDGNTSNNGENYDPENPGMYHGGDFAGVTEKLDYLEDLGVNTIWITPIVENISNPQNTDNPDVPQTVGYHGYWADDFTTLDSHLGTEEEFQTLIEEAHARDMKIMVDVVLNHAGYGTEDIFGDMLRNSETTVPGDEVKDSLSGLPDFYTENPEVREQLVDWQTAWVSEFDIDYFRVDTVKHVDNTTWQAFKNALTEVNPEFKMIGEYSGAGYSFDGGQLKNGQMDALLDFDFNDTGLDLATGNLQKVETFLEKRNAALSSDATLGSFLSSHDEDGLLYSMINSKGIPEEKARDLMKVAASMQITAKGQPIIYYGEELGQTGANNYPYQTNRYDLDWNIANDSNDMLTHYKTMLGIRQAYSEILAEGDRTALFVDEENGVLVFDRSLDGQHLITALNISEEAQDVTITLPTDVKTITGNLYTDDGNITTVKNNTISIQVPAAEAGGTYIFFGDTSEQPIETSKISYSTHVQNLGWQSYVSDGAMSGTKSQSLRLEGIKIRLDDSMDGGVEYRTHVQNLGWQSYVSDDVMSGTTGKSLRLEAIQIRLTGAIAEQYDIYYRTHIQDKGWLGWAMNDGKSGSAGLSKRLEAIEIRFVEKGGAAPGSTQNAYLTNKKEANPTISYRTHVQNEGWQTYVTGGVMSGTKGKSLRLEAIQISVNGDGLNGSIEYSSHVQNEGWQAYVTDDAISGTKGRSLRLEAIKIRLTGELAQKYSVEYRTHVQNEGWKNWVKDDAMSGTTGKNLRLEAIEIRLIKK